MNRRAFLTGLLCAPALVRASSLDFIPRGERLAAWGMDFASRPSFSVVMLATVKLSETGEAQWSVERAA